MITLPDMNIQPIVLADPRDIDEAAALIADLGDGARAEIARRAADSRDIGNVRHFCRWRQIGRIVDMLSGESAAPTLH